MKILNMIQHPASPEQKAAGVEDLPECYRHILKNLLLETIPSPEDIRKAVGKVLSIIDVMNPSDGVMIGGAPFLMPVLEQRISDFGYQPLYAFSVRDSVEEVIDGKTVKRSVFKHLGFVSGAQKARFVWEEFNGTLNKIRIN